MIYNYNNVFCSMNYMNELMMHLNADLVLEIFLIIIVNVKSCFAA